MTTVLLMEKALSQWEFKIRLALGCLARWATIY